MFSKNLPWRVNFSPTTHDNWPRPGHPGNLDGHHSASSWGYISLVGGTRIQIGHIAQAVWEWKQQ